MTRGATRGATIARDRRIAILGATGSVGRATIDVIGHLATTGEEKFRVAALTANNNVALLADQARRLLPEFVAIGDTRCYADLRQALSGLPIRIGAGPEALVEAASLPTDIVMAAIVGSAGLAPTLAAVRRGVTIALANKECLVSAGELFMREVREHGATLIPVDSEHSAIFQLFDARYPEAIERLVLTASGGPFRTADLAHMAKATPTEAIAHPTWSMGQKISVDSATLMNKGLELIEAHHLFGIEAARLDVVIHPQSLVHSFVIWRDGSILIHAGAPDMRTPIAVALGWPRRVSSPAKRLELTALANLGFEAPDFTRFPALAIARHALQAGGGAPTILNAANEVAVEAFLNRAIGFLDIVATVEKCLERIGARASPDTLEEMFALDGETRRIADEHVKDCVVTQ